MTMSQLLELLRRVKPESREALMQEWKRILREESE